MHSDGQSPGFGSVLSVKRLDFKHFTVLKRSANPVIAQYCRQSCRRHQVSDNARSDSERQLLMGLFGEGGTRKSRVINAIRKWFQVRGMSDELLITATTGAAAVKIGGRTLHSAIGLRKDGKVNRVSKKVMDLWFNRHYLIIDEVSMMDTKLFGNLQTQLSKIKSDSDADFGGVNILFAGDFLQLPTVSHMDVYI